MKLQNKVAIITGGAMGNGLGIAKVFLKTPGIFDNISRCSSNADLLAELKKLV